MKGEKQVTMKNGRPAMQGICPVCGTKMFKIGGGATSTKSKAKVAIKQATKKKARKTVKAKKK